MTDRAEIERLLQMTGRTLEWLPEDYGDKKLELWNSFRDKTFGHIKSFGMANRILHQSDVIELLVGALRDALEKPMQKPMTLEELWELASDDNAFVWEERRNPDNFVKSCAGALAIMCLDARKDPDIAFAYTYNVAVRAWRTLPTDEERVAAAWET